MWFLELVLSFIDLELGYAFCRCSFYDSPDFPSIGGSLPERARGIGGITGLGPLFLLAASPALRGPNNGDSAGSFEGPLLDRLSGRGDCRR